MGNPDYSAVQWSSIHIQLIELNDLHFAVQCERNTFSKLNVLFCK